MARRSTGPGGRPGRGKSGERRIEEVPHGTLAETLHGPIYAIYGTRRALEVLELVGTPEAQQVSKSMAEGASEARADAASEGIARPMGEADQPHALTSQPGCWKP